MLLNNPLFDGDKILEELKKLNPKGALGRKSAIKIMQNKIKSIYKIDLNDEYLITQFPRLLYVLRQIFSESETIEIPEELKDWEPSVSFADINHKYGYFDADLSTIFQRLAISCCKMTSLIERQAPDDEMAYKLMALFYDPTLTEEENVNNISQKFDSLITTKQDKKIETPYHDALVTKLHHFPKHETIKNFESWQAFITKGGFKTLRIFSECASSHPAFENTQQGQAFLLKQKYPRAEEDPKLAKICKDMLISNQSFEAGLQEVESGWPKKERDNLPIVDIADDSGKYFWVKLPPQDMRALYLGRVIPGCCQFIDGASRQCVKDGIRLTDNGFYVLLKAKKNKKSARVTDGEINDKDYDIVAQSYAWKSNNGNLCLDSIEWNPKRVTVAIIQHVMAKFSDEVFKQQPQIKHITAGQRGQTPKDMYPPCQIHETIKKGRMYQDAIEQYRIASNVPLNIEAALQERLKRLNNPEFEHAVLYLAPYFDDIQSIPDALISINPNIINELPRFIKRINLPPTLSANDFKKISFDEYQGMVQSEKNRISTVCKIFNSEDNEACMQWLPTIPDDELTYILLTDSVYQVKLKIEILKRLPIENRLAALKEKDGYDRPVLLDAVSNPDSLKRMLNLLPPEQRFLAVKEKSSYRGSVLYNAASNPESLKIILKLLPNDAERLLAVKENSGYDGTLLYNAASDPESLKMIFELLATDAERLAAVKEGSCYGRNILSRVASHPDSLKLILNLLPTDAERLVAVKEKSRHDESVLYNAASNPESLKMILELFPAEERLSALKEKDKTGLSILNHVAANPESLKMTLILIPAEHRLAAVKAKDRNGPSVLNYAAAKHDYLRIILELLPTEQRLLALKEKDRNGVSVLNYAAANPECLKMILELLPAEQILLAGKEKDRNALSILNFAASNPESLEMVLDLYPPEQRLTAVKEGNRYGKLLSRVASKPESLKMILELYPPEERLLALKEGNLYNPILSKIVTNSEFLKIILKLLPEDIASVIQTCKRQGNVIEYAASIEQFKSDMKSLADPDSISKFIRALIQNKGIEEATQSLFTTNRSFSFFSFFSSNNNPDIQKSIDNLHPFWKNRIHPATEESKYPKTK
jgi:hypothetical protein